MTLMIAEYETKMFLFAISWFANLRKVNSLPSIFLASPLIIAQQTNSNYPKWLRALIRSWNVHTKMAEKFNYICHSRK